MSEEQSVYLCTLDREYNECPFFDGQQFCTNPSKACGMLRKQEKPEKYVRKARWYEKYYSNS